MDQTDDNQQDLHELVTLEPNLQDYANMSEMDTPAQNNETTRRHSRASSISPLFSQSAAEPPPTVTSPRRANTISSTLSSPRNSRALHSSQGSASLNMSRRQSVYAHTGGQSGTHCIPSTSSQPSHPFQNTRPQGSSDPVISVTNAEKEIDDLDDSYDVRPKGRTLIRQNTSTSARVNRLFAPGWGSAATSRVNSFQKQPQDADYHNAESGETSSLPHHLLSRGLLQGKHSDITVKAFGHSYHLHRIILDRAPFFASALSEPWCEANQKEIELHPEEIDINITQIAFELALKRLYGCALPAEEDEEAVGLFATGCWLEMHDLVGDSVEAILKHMNHNTLAPFIRVVTDSYYGAPGDKVLASAKAMLCRNGSDMPLKAWDGVPSDLIQELVGSDGFFVRDEWSRWRLAKRLLDRRLKQIAREVGLWQTQASQASQSVPDRAIRIDQAEMIDEDFDSPEDAKSPLNLWEVVYGHEDIRPLLKLVDYGVHYVHMDFEQLQSIRSARDVLGVPVLSEGTIQEALWSNLELRQKILNATEKELTLGLAHYTYETSSGSNERQQASQIYAEAPESSKAASKRPATIQSSDAKGSVNTFEDGRHGTRRYIVPSVDCNVVLGGNEEPVYTYRNGDNKRAADRVASGEPGADNTELEDVTATSPGSPLPTGSTEGSRQITYSNYPPFRFAVEFPSSRMLKDRKKVFSHTVFYAGSLWNVYIKKVKSSTKNPHLGVYLHRALQHQNSKPGNVPRGAVDERIGMLEHRMSHRGYRIASRSPGPTYLSYGQNMPPQDSTQPVTGTSATSGPMDVNLSDAVTGRVPWRRQNIGSDEYLDSNSPNTEGLHPTSFDDNDDSSESESSDNTMLDLDSLTYQPRPRVPTLSPYVDTRPTVKTYFKIYSPTRGGRVLSVYESVPDMFNFSQSWGWKSSTLLIDEEEDADEFTLPVAETSFVDDETVGADLLEAGEGHGGEQGMKKTSSMKTPATSHGLRFMVVLGVV